MKTSIIISGLGLLALTGCSTDIGNPEKLSSTAPDIRQGPEVRQLCFTNSINGWAEGPDRKSIILTKGVQDQYLVTVSGVCDIDDAFMNVGLDTFGGSSCLSQGDKIYTDAQTIGGPCYVRNIYEWNADAEEETSEEMETETE